MINIVLFEPEIPPNTGNIIRLCANTDAQLHLIEPLGFSLDDKKLRRAGLDYHEFSQVKTYPDYAAFLEQNPDGKKYAITTKGSQCYSTVHYDSANFLVFGPETRGLPDEILESEHMHGRIRIPMQANSRSLNLSNSVAVILYEACRQMNFDGLR
ncbi:MAG: tRNA (uridine(34)/cytosine(34)/5-carboxymethylaminomethyluridine(34)-2'-O)-methyltransferase TrmL [Pseudomonadota bacterium]